MVFEEIKAIIELYEKFRKHEKISKQQKTFEKVLIEMYYFSKQSGEKAVTGRGSYATTERELNSIEELSKMDLFNSIREGEAQGFLRDCSSFNQREWHLTLDGETYVEALIEQIKK